MEKLLDLLKASRGVTLSVEKHAKFINQDIQRLTDIRPITELLKTTGYTREAETLSEVCAQCTKSEDLGGLGLTLNTELEDPQRTEVFFLFSAWLEALNSADRAEEPLRPLTFRPQARRAMTLTEKIFAMHDVERKGFVKPGQMSSVTVDWILASELSWASMELTYKELNEPGIFRNDRFWLAPDHVVDPRINQMPQVKKLIEATERAKREFKMTDSQGLNYTILHTEFYRERAQPGMITIGSDSHTCSSGAVGCLSIGLGVDDVTLALVTGEIWFKIPEVINIRLVGKPGLGIGGKDTMLYILKELKRNTVASDRVVEYTGPGLKYLSIDARFAIANMTTEFGGITGIFEPDETTRDFINARKSPRHRNSSYYMRADEDAIYAETCEIDLSNVRPFVALYPKPDNVVPITEFEGTELDGCFIGACTTAEEAIILGALVLEQGLKNGKSPISKGKRKVVPGSRPILHRLEQTGLADIYRKAGFEVGIPGCSYCVGMSADRAGEGEVWFSSQNRNFENRMGKGSIGHLASAATVAASSFDMKATDPTSFIGQIDMKRWDELRAQKLLPSTLKTDVSYVEPAGTDLDGTAHSEVALREDATVTEGREADDASGSSKNKITGKVQQLGDYIDTDALAPAQFLVGATSDEAIGEHCLEFTHPDFRAKVKEGYNIVVAGKAFGVGSSRQEAVRALLGCGVQCVIAESFAFIYSRNQPNLGLIGITITDPRFYELAIDGADISVDFDKNVLAIGREEFMFEFSQMEKKLMELGGIRKSFHKHGKQLFQKLCAPNAKSTKVFTKPAGAAQFPGPEMKSELAW